MLNLILAKVTLMPGCVENNQRVASRGEKFWKNYLEERLNRGPAARLGNRAARLGETNGRK
jgi:hypothetical protein